MTMFPDFAAELDRRGLLPDSTVCLWVAGSMTQGWSSDTSDYDLYVASKDPWQGAGDRLSVALDPGVYITEAFFHEGRPWEIRYWTTAQIEQILEKVGWDETLASIPPAGGLSVPESVLLQRLPDAVASVGAEHLRRWQETCASSALRPMTVLKLLDCADGSVDDALGQLRTGDMPSAVLAARRAFECAVDALLASHGEIGESPKWRSRRLRKVQPAALSFEQYWDIETMRQYRPDDAAAWVLYVVRFVKDLVLEVKVY